MAAQSVLPHPVGGVVIACTPVQATWMLALLCRDGAFPAETVAVLLSVVQVALVVVELVRCTDAVAPGAMSPKLQLSTWLPTVPAMLQVPGPV
jgi:hypothetical protein